MRLVIESESSPETEATIESFLKSHATGVLATSDTAANPHGAVVYYQYHDDHTVTFATKSETQKYKNIEENKQVALVVYDEVEQIAVQIMGRVELVEDRELGAKIVNNMYLSSTVLSKRVIPPVEKLYAGEYKALRLIPTVIKMAVYARPDSEGDDLYETLLFSES